MFDAEKFIEKAVEEIKSKVKGKAVIATSGGVDSTVAAKIGSMALGENLVAIYVDTGYMRKGEGEKVKKIVEGMGIKLRYVDASKEFYEALKGVTDPEQKRKIIGEKFIRVFEREALEEKAEYLIQGTIAPDWIESGGGLRDTIKSHHNVGGLPPDINLEIVEPLRDLYKDEVRKVARALGLEVAEKQPFPGPGLAVRIIGEATEEKAKVIREACHIVEEEIEKAAEEKKMSKPWQYFAVLLPVKTVGVHGDRRAYGHTIAIRSVESVDAMTADFSHIPYEVLDRISTRITNELNEVNRIVYDITNKPPGTVEWE
ncbi:MAG: glutamine-hydrolyzing GMP synthase subunit GuaA [Thermoplasmata archaeon]|nr:MAG: glutamine-hydrolyzing GMP synthase subunit GuaA [Thermoplasmata archaeon]HDH81555.1 glutamine-hydrolyzing GMP synthase subunit GuaA [Thermoplasmatales archaeon]MCD6146503.1 glutamine-hydrolyzing GMP synthase subunit GuaA [Thermoplasmata archaeon]RLF45686.1 MAG: glutamine-hydrolyzing GMP synthase subunit GuaA [Thermoplasmata archaeon]RLF49265.1 MAG: glutamine-hydrolyzing GMP synthase subunit GuaA [Thermoplasmata archaeon]